MLFSLANSGVEGMASYLREAFVHDIFLDNSNTHISGSAMSRDMAYLNAVILGGSVEQ